MTGWPMEPRGDTQPAKSVQRKVFGVVQYSGNRKICLLIVSGVDQGAHGQLHGLQVLQVYDHNGFHCNKSTSAQLIMCRTTAKGVIL